MITYNASVQGHGIIRELVKNLETKSIILERHKYIHPSSIVTVLTLLALINGAGNTPLARVALQMVKDGWAVVMNMNLRSVETIWRDELVRDVELAHRTKDSAICLSGDKRW